MYIEKIKIGNFGKLSDREFDLTTGLNIIEGRNESGKSTLSEFIKFVFYGLSSKSPAGSICERERYISWRSNNVSGSIVINTNGGRYRIEREMTAHGAGYKDRINIVDLSTNSIVSGIKNPGEHFFGIPEEVFVHTVYIRQTEGASFEGESIGQAVENIFYSADESVNTDKALKKLDEARVQIKHKKNTGRGFMDSLERERDELTVRLAEARKASELIMQNEASLRNNSLSIEKNKSESKRLYGQIRKAELRDLLCKFDERKKYSDIIEKYKNGKAEVISATTFNGFFPDDSYISELEKCKGEITYLKKDVDSYEEQQETNSGGKYSKELAEIIKSYGGEQGMTERFSMLKSKKRTLFISAAVFCALAVITAFSGWYMGRLFTKLVPVFVLLGAVFIAAFLISSIMCFRTNGSIKEWFDVFSVDDERKLFEKILSILECERGEAQKNELTLYRAEKRKDAENRLSESIKNSLSVLWKWGIRPEKSDFINITGCIDSVISDIREITKNIFLYDKEIEKNQAVLSVIEGQLAGYDERVLCDEYNAIKIEDAGIELDEIKKKYDFTTRAREMLIARQSELEKSLIELRAKNDRPAELDSRLKLVENKIDELTFKHSAYILAYEKLQSAGESLRGKLAPGLSAAAGRLMGSLTDGKYDEIGVSDSLKMTYTFEDSGSVYTKSIDYVSSGTQDIAYMSLRLALAEMFSRSGEKLPVVFDEAFSRLDDVRLGNMLRVVYRYSKNASQAIVLTSQTREAEILLNDTGIQNVNRIYI